MGVTEAQLERSRAIQRRTGRTFYLATRFLPERVREPTHVLYAFFRLADEIVDGGGSTTPEAQRAALAELRDAVLGDATPEDPVVAAFAEVRRSHGIPAEDVETFLDAMAQDVDTDRYRSYEELEGYMDGSAAAVGRMMTAIMAPDDPEAAMPHATALGEAFQLTNFVRDVREDARDLGRVYLPATTLADHGASQADVLALRSTESVRRAVAAEVLRAETLYRDGVAGIGLLPEDCRFPVTLAAVLYADHHRRVRAVDYDVVSQRPSLSRARALRLSGRTWVAWRRSGRDPEETFYRASCVPRTPDDAPPAERVVPEPETSGPGPLVRDRLPSPGVGGKIAVLFGR